MEKELQTIPTEKDFNLSKVKLLPKGGIQAEYQVTQIVDGETSLIDRSETCNRDPEHWQNRVTNEVSGKIETEAKSSVSLSNVPDSLLAQVIDAINGK